MNEKTKELLEWMYKCNEAVVSHYVDSIFEIEINHGSKLIISLNKKNSIILIKHDFGRIVIFNSDLDGVLELHYLQNLYNVLSNGKELTLKQ